MDKALPPFIPPMLAVQGRPFDSKTHFFEFKWDGIRAGAFIEGGGVRLMSRNGRDISDRYPDLASLRSLPKGLVLDGEVVAFRDGRPDFELVLGNLHGSKTDAIAFVAFDVLFKNFDSLMDLPFEERRRRLEEILGNGRTPRVILSEGVPAHGRNLFEKACGLGLEGVMAKRLSSEYAAGKRNRAWIKIKRRLRLQLAVIGYIEKGGDDFQSLLVAGNGLPDGGDGKLRYMGKVGGGFSEAMRARINALLRAHPRSAPLVPCPERARWIEPGLYCVVSFTEVTSAGVLRAPVFEELIDA